MTPYTLTFLLACTLIGAFAAVAYTFWRTNSPFWVGAIPFLAALTAFMEAADIWSKHMEDQS